MASEVITVKTFSNIGSVNGYLIKTNDGGFILIDTGWSAERALLEKQLEHAGCHPGNLNLIILTHGDSDHAGNAAYLRKKYGAKIAMHRIESGIVQKGDLRSTKINLTFSKRIILSFFRLGKSDQFKPDIYLEEGDDLTEYGLAARILHLPGHSKGSIGILTSNDDLFCGDFFRNKFRPSIGTIDDPSDYESSFEKLKKIKINLLYPGHGRPFRMNEILSLTRSEEPVQSQP
jgi:glyoxylase-like metal-dependent hydrolase (beta-lactamase superfamily II)